MNQPDWLKTPRTDALLESEMKSTARELERQLIEHARGLERQRNRLALLVHTYIIDGDTLFRDDIRYEAQMAVQDE